MEQGRGYEPFTLYRASSAAAPSDQSPKVPFVARGMSLLETSIFLQEEKVNAWEHLPVICVT